MHTMTDPKEDAVYEVFSVFGHEGVFPGDFEGAKQKARESWGNTGAWTMVIDRASPAGYPSRVVFVIDAAGDEYGMHNVWQGRWRELY